MLTWNGILDAPRRAHRPHGLGQDHGGNALAARLGRTFVDNDAVLEARTGRSARRDRGAEGADALHLREAEALVFAFSTTPPAVVAAAAAAPLEAGRGRGDARSRGRLPARDVAVIAVGLDPPTTTVTGRSSPRTRGALDAQFATLTSATARSATLVVDATPRRPETIVDEISRALAP